MKVYLDKQKQALIKPEQWLFLDTSFLSLALREEFYLETLIELFPKSGFLIDPVVKFEFSRDSPTNNHFEKKQAFLNNDLFIPLSRHNDHLQQTFDNALEISHIYAHSKKPAPPLGDLLFMGTVMTYKNVYVITADFQDFNQLLFDRLNLLSFEKDDGKIDSVQILEFNKEKLSICQQNRLRAST